MSFNRLPRHVFAEGKRRGKERLKADKQFPRLIGSLDLILNTRKIIFVMSEIYLNENSQNRASFLIFIVIF